MHKGTWVILSQSHFLSPGKEAILVLETLAKKTAGTNPGINSDLKISSLTVKKNQIAEMHHIYNAAF